MVNVMLGCTAVAAFTYCLALPSAASATAAAPRASTSAAASMRALFSDWGADVHLQRNLHGSDGTVLRQLDLGSDD